MIKKKTPAKSHSKAARSPVQAAKKAPAKKVTEKVVKAVAKKTTKPAPVKISKPVATKDAPAKKVVPKSTPKTFVQDRGALSQTFIKQPAKRKNQKLSPFFEKQRTRLLMLKDTLLDSMQGVARDNLHAGSQTSAFGMHQADAGSDAYDRDFALSILSQEQNSLYEIDEALKRIDDGTYGVCEISNKQIPRVRLEARPFTRFTVECQADLEKRQHVVGTRLPVSALFGLTEEESENEDDENLLEPTKD